MKNKLTVIALITLVLASCGKYGQIPDLSKETGVELHVYCDHCMYSIQNIGVQGDSTRQSLDIYRVSPGQLLVVSCIKGRVFVSLKSGTNSMEFGEMTPEDPARIFIIPKNHQRI